MDKGPGSSSLHGSPRADSGQNQANPSRQRFHNRGFGQNLGGSFPHDHPPNSRGARIRVLPRPPPPPPYPVTVYPIWQPYLGIGVLAPVQPLLPLPPPYPATTYVVWQSNGIGILPPVPPPPPFPMRAYPTWQPESLPAEICEVTLLQPPLPPPLPYPMRAYPTWQPNLHWCTVPIPPYPMTAYPTWQQDPTSASDLHIAPQEIQFQGVDVGQPSGRRSNQLPPQNLHQQRFPRMHPNSHQMNRPFAEPQLVTWIDPLFTPWPMRNSYYDPQHEEMLITMGEFIL